MPLQTPTYQPTPSHHVKVEPVKVQVKRQAQAARQPGRPRRLVGVHLGGAGPQAVQDHTGTRGVCSADQLGVGVEGDGGELAPVVSVLFAKGQGVGTERGGITRASQLGPWLRGRYL